MHNSEFQIDSDMIAISSILGVRNITIYTSNNPP